MSWEEGFQQAQAQTAINQNAGLRRSVDEFADALDQANANIDYAQQVINDRNREITALRQELAALTTDRDRHWTAYNLERAQAEGLMAYVNAFKEAHPDSPVMADSGKRYKKSGNTKTMGRMLYEAAFDTSIREHMTGPIEDYRVD